MLDQVRVDTELAALADRDMVIEAIVEDGPAKVRLFSALDQIVTAPDAIFASTSSIPIMKLAVATSRPSHVVGLHFFNPVPVLSLVELVPSLLTDADVAERVRVFARDTLGKHVIDSQDRAGQRTAVRPAAAAGEDGRRRPVRPQIRAWFLPLRGEPSVSASKFDLFTLPERYDALRAAVRAVVEARSPHTRPMWTNGRGDGGMATRCGQRIVMRRPQLRS